ncbi:hypothetical protein LTR70_001915 [Exophiala xenobiotica]|uniref:Ribosomal protein S2 n=1 Tax=Lithohypha guttulata TaxID=1690604 RepID=A0ABR0KA61_9EURO|nr:hypothetical protein LTR24_005413 [Lithohypha guttulata]KAK5326900.1 hypothetical protein LTR70_001915 [Exophiala xenobiotica]
MILRQTIVRHGRTAISRSTKRIRSSPCRCYATDYSINNQQHRQSEQDHQPIRSIPGHPDERSSLLDAIGHQGTPATAPIEDSVSSSAQDLDSLRGQVLSYVAAQNASAIPSPKSYHELQNKLPPAPYENPQALYEAREAFHQLTSGGTTTTDVYYPWTIIQNPPQPAEVTLPMLLANQCHLGHATALWHPGNSSYIYGIRDGIHIISLDLTLSYLRRAARVVQEVARRGGIILFVGTRKQMRDVVVNSARRAGGYHIFNRWIPGSLTNGQQILDRCAVKVVNAQDQELEQYRAPLQSASRTVLRPDLVVCLNTLENEVCLHECGLYNVPTIGIVDTDVNPSWVTYPIPANDDSPRSVALISGALARAGETGQTLRRQAAEDGKTTYSTTGVQRYLQGMGEIASLNVQEKSKEGKPDKDFD